MSKRKFELESDKDNIIIQNTKKKTLTVLDKIIMAIRSQKSPNGSSLQSIKKYCEIEFNYNNSLGMKKILKNNIDNGILTKNKASFLVTSDPIYEDLSEKVDIINIIIGKDSKEVTKGDNVTISYTGTLHATGNKFESASNFEFIVGVGDVIKGMDQGVIGMCIGGRRKVIIPSSLAYGKRGSSPDIPSDSILCFDIKLKKLE